jgi:sarcosine oxidase subunit beta
MSYDIAVIGAGVHGASTAFHLSRRGISTIVFDRGSPAGGPTGQSSGIVRSYYTNPFMAEVARDSTQFFSEFAHRTGGGECGYRRTGGIYLHGEVDVEHVRQTAEVLTKLVIEHEVMSVPQLAERFPGFDLEGVAMGVWEERAGYADPHRTTLDLLAAASRSGSEVRSYSQVTRIKEKSKSVGVLLADGTEYEVGRVLIAAGPWTAPLLGQLSDQVPLTVERHVVGVLGQSSPITSFALPHVLIDVVGGYYSRPLEPDQFLLGPLAPSGEVDPDEFSAQVTDLEFAWLADRAVRRVPSRSLAAARSSWASLYDVSPDWQPVIGQVSEHTFVDAGTSGHGFKLAPALGEYVARLLMDDADERLEQFSPFRFAEGSLLSSGFGAARILG